ncbi:vegetative cell wall protein gp1-like [Oryza sativa Japonica Group]|uniref:vegetative cell wall protein gp1-like n=1 Tax=Oryza sativa subsp. japonica TaxID=39947 RepID=UPI00339C5A9C
MSAPSPSSSLGRQLPWPPDTPTSPPLPRDPPLPRIRGRGRRPRPPPLPPLPPRKTAPSHLHSAPRCRPHVAGWFPPLSGSIPPPLPYKNNPRPPLIRFPHFPHAAAPSLALPAPSPRAAALWRTPAAPRRRSRPPRTAPSPSPAPQSSCTPRPPLLFPNPPPQRRFHLHPEPPSPLAASIRSPPASAASPGRAFASNGFATSHRTPASTPSSPSTPAAPFPPCKPKPPPFTASSRPLLQPYGSPRRAVCVVGIAVPSSTPAPTPSPLSASGTSPPRAPLFSRRRHLASLRRPPLSGVAPCFRRFGRSRS